MTHGLYPCEHLIHAKYGFESQSSYQFMKFGSIPTSIVESSSFTIASTFADMAEQVDATDLKSVGIDSRAGSSPAIRTNEFFVAECLVSLIYRNI